jgi:serine/threonine protein kinase
MTADRSPPAQRAIPARNRFLWLTIEALLELGGRADRHAIRDAAVRLGAFSADQLALLPPPSQRKSYASRVEYELSWALTILRKAEVVTNERGEWELTEPGRALKEADMPDVMRSYRAPRADAGNPPMPPVATSVPAASGPPSDPLIGTELDAFRIDALIARGGMGIVYRATQLALRRTVALKVLAEDLAEDKDFRARFQREIDNAAAVEHPNVVPVYDAGYDAGRFYIAMQYIDGPDLAKLAGGQMDLDRALKLFDQIAAGLQYIHDCGFVHRDVKPQNVLVWHADHSEETAMLTDFGISLALDKGSDITRGRPPGTPRYMAPEVTERWETGPAADQYSLACVLFELLAGRTPFEAVDRVELEQAHVSSAVPDIEHFVPNVPVQVGQSLRRALAKDPGARFADVREFAFAVRGDLSALSLPGEDLPSQGVAIAGDVDERRLAPAQVSRRLFVVAPDRDERSPQLAMETLLTLRANDFKPLAGEPLAGPKRRNGALRSLAIGENFLEGIDAPAAPGLSTEALGGRLAKGQDFLGSDGLSLAQQALRALIDPRTRQGSDGATLMLPFHESLLWYDARASGAAGARWAVRKVNMRGTGVTLARLLLEPPSYLEGNESEAARRAVDGIRAALQAPSPFAELSARLDVAAPEEPSSAHAERDEDDAWRAADSPKLAPLARRVVRHAAAIMDQPHVSPSAKLLQLRAILALDLAYYSLLCSWDATVTPPEQRYLLVSFTPEPRARNRVRMRSEASYQAARLRISQAIVATLATTMYDLADDDQVDWSAEFEPRSKLDEVALALPNAHESGDYLRLAGIAFERASGSGYNRPSDAFRVLLESVDLLAGTGKYRWLRAGPELLGALVGSVTEMPMSADRFLAHVFSEWGIVVGDAEAVRTELADDLDGAQLRRNAHWLEQLLTNSGLAISLSDQTCMVGQRALAVT